MIRLRHLFILFSALVTLLANDNASAQAVDGDEALLGTRVSTFVVHNSVVLDGLAQLSSESVALSFSFEEVLKAKFNDPPLSEQRFNLELRDHTVRQILDALCNADPRYIWTRDGLTINVYPQATASDSSYLLNRKVAKLQLNGVTQAAQAMFAIVKQLPPPFEQIAFAQAGGDISYREPWRANFSDLTVRQAFNLVARHLGPRGGWVLSGSREFRTVGFHNREIHYSSRHTEASN